MSAFFNMPPGCLGPSDIDHHAALGHYDFDMFCQRCKQNPCECCQRCGAAPDQACEKWCGMPEGEPLPENPSSDMIEYWQQRSDLFAFEIRHIVERCE